MEKVGAKSTIVVYFTLCWLQATFVFAGYKRLLSSLITFANSLDPDQAPPKFWAWSGSKLFDPVMVLKKYPASKESNMAHNKVWRNNKSNIWKSTSWSNYTFWGMCNFFDHLECNFSQWLSGAKKFHSPARSYEWKLERTSNFPHSSRPVGPVLWDELIEEVILHITPLWSLLHILLKDCECVCRNSEYCKSLVLQDKCNIDFFPPDLYL